MRPLILSLIALTACGGDALTTADVDAAVQVHADATDAHAGLFATPTDVSAAVNAGLDAHDADANAHQGLFATPDDVDAALAAYQVTPAQLPTRRARLSIPLGSAFDLGGGNDFTGGGFGNTSLHIMDTAGSDFRINFTVPEDIAGESMTLELAWRINQTGCTVDLRPNSVDRVRVGLPPASGSATDGLNGPWEALTVPATADIATAYTYTLTGGGGYPGLLPGDGISISLYRATGDSCTADARIQGISLTYDAK